MKKSFNFISAWVLMSALCVGFVACNDEPDGQESGLGEEIPGLEVKQATGTVIGSFSNGFGALLLQVDEEYPIGGTIEYVYQKSCLHLPETGTYRNMIQVQWKLPVDVGHNKISFSVREYDAEREKDRDLFTVGSGLSNALCLQGPNPDMPIYVITEYEIITE